MRKNRLTSIAVIALVAVLALCSTVLLQMDSTAKADARKVHLFVSSDSVYEGDTITLTIKLDSDIDFGSDPYTVNLQALYGKVSPNSVTLNQGGETTATYTAPTADITHPEDVEITAYLVGGDEGHHDHEYVRVKKLADIIIPQVSPSYADIYVGDKQYFSLQNFTGTVASVVSSDAGVAEVKQDGNSGFTVTGKKEGTAVITLTTSNGAKVDVSVVVRKIPLRIETGEVYMRVNSTKFYTIKAKPTVDGYAAPVTGFKYTDLAAAIADHAASSTDTLLIQSKNVKGTAPIQVELDTSLSDKYYLVNAPCYINVHVQDSDETAIYLSFSPDITTLNKGSETYMTIHVDAPQSDYVKITRSDLRTYVKDYNYSHPSTYVYWSKLDAAGNTTVLIKPQYSGKSTITVSADGAKNASRTFTVTGYPTMPQTGPNYTAIMVVGGLSMLALCAATVMKFRKKQAE